jgi:hypothetical protein
MEFAEALALQEEIVAKKREDLSPADELLLLEHEPVYTIGRMPDKSSLLGAAHLPHPFFSINRGGQATYHGPGQLMGYPIIDLRRCGQDLHRYLRWLEQRSSRFSPNMDCGVAPGIAHGSWIDDRKTLLSASVCVIDHHARIRAERAAIFRFSGIIFLRHQCNDIDEKEAQDASVVSIAKTFENWRLMRLHACAFHNNQSPPMKSESPVCFRSSTYLWRPSPFSRPARRVSRWGFIPVHRRQHSAQAKSEFRCLSFQLMAADHISWGGDVRQETTTGAILSSLGRESMPSEVACHDW